MPPFDKSWARCAGQRADERNTSIVANGPLFCSTMANLAQEALVVVRALVGMVAIELVESVHIELSLKRNVLGLTLHISW